MYTLNADKEVCFTVGMHPATIRELEVAGYLQVWPATVNRCEHTHKYIILNFDKYIIKMSTIPFQNLDK